VHAAPDQQISLTDPDARAMGTSGKGTAIVGYNVQCQRRRKNASIFRNKNTSVKLARRAGNLEPLSPGSGLRPFIRRGVGTGAA
jgi:hypothetical protein